MLDKYKSIKSRDIKQDSEYTRICLVGTIYSLFLYLLITNESEYKSTLFILGKAISEDIKKKLPHVISIDNDKYLEGNLFNRFLQKFKLYHCTRKKFKCLNRLPIFGHDHLSFSPGLIGNRKLTVIEDGLANYTKSSYLAYHAWWKRLLYSFLYGPLSVQNKYGTSQYADKVILTELQQIPDILMDKSEIVRPNIIWNECSLNKRQFICNVFGLDSDDLERIRSKSIILLTTPPYYKLSQNEIISKYKMILENYDHNEVVIKTHPRDKYDYQKLFPETFVFNKPIPFELLVLMGCEFSTAITINSSAVCNLPSSTNIIYL